MTTTTLKHETMLVSTHSKGRAGKKVRCIVVHHEAGNLTASQLKSVFQNRKSSATYGIDVNGNITQYVDESDRPWTTGGSDPDNYSITIEMANSSTGGTWPVSDATIRACVKLCADICKRYGIPSLYYDGKKGTLLRHCDFQSTACPGPYFKGITTAFCKLVNDCLTADTGKEATEKKTLYRVQTGAFTEKANADKQVEELKKAGFDSIIKTESR